MTEKPKGKKRGSRRLSVAIVGAGRLAAFLAVALREAGFSITEIVTRDNVPSLRRARLLAAKVSARAVGTDSASLDASLLWICVPDGEIRNAGAALANRLTTSPKRKARFAFHSSGALLSRELGALRRKGVAVASVHPLMTFVAGSHPSLAGVPFALEGDAAAIRIAQGIVSALGGESFRLPPLRKAAYHAWATMTSPLLLGFLVALEEAASFAGITRREARCKSLPIIKQTLTNYSRLGPARSFSGPLVRGDAKTVAKHLAVLKKYPGAREVYTALARAALRGLPVKNRKEIARMLQL